MLRVTLAGLTLSTGLMLTAPAALANDTPKHHPHCIIDLLGIKVCLKT
jgi:hypothetical protein